MKRALVVAAVLVGALLLRLPGLGDELWYDEIVTDLRLAHRSALDVLTTYESQNQHVLYSFVARLALDLFGDSPAVLRAPSVAFGVLGIAALYLVGRELVSEREALLGAALLAVSYQHVWFSQNARGYTALLFWTLVSSWLFLRGLAGGGRRVWLAYGVASALGLHTHLTMAFVVVGHAAMAWRRGGLSRSGAWIGFGATAVLTLALYAPLLHSIAAVTAVEGRSGPQDWKSTGWAAGEVARGLQASFGGWVVAGAAILFGAAGLWRLARRRSPLIELTVLPVAIGAAVVLGSGHHLWPRFFFFSIGFAALIAVAGAFEIGRTLERYAGARGASFAGSTLAVAMIVAGAAALPGAYGVKQRFREALDLVQRERRAGEVVLVAGSATRVYREYYATDWKEVQEAWQMEEVRSASPGTWLVHSFPIQLRAHYPELTQAIEEKLELVARLEGTVHGGDVLVWHSKPVPSGATEVGR